MEKKEHLHMPCSNMHESPDKILQKEFLQERVAVLGRAGNSLPKSLEKPHNIEKRIEAYLNRLKEREALSWRNESRRRMILEINREISKYNQERGYVLLQYYSILIVTREALGMRRHH